MNEHPKIDYAVLKIIAAVSTCVSVALAIRLIKQAQDGVFNETSWLINHPSGYYTDIIKTKYYDTDYVHEALTDLSLFYDELSIPYEMYVADYHDEPMASDYLYMSITDFYKDLH